MTRPVISTGYVSSLQNDLIACPWPHNHSLVDSLCLVIHANGGVRAEDMERIFTPFFSHKFLGPMGLPLALGMVRGHDGCITIFSQPEIGTTVRVCLPLEVV